MFARIKKSGAHRYVQVVHNERVNGRVRQRVIATLGRLDVLKQSGHLDGLVESLAKFSDHLAVLNALKANQITPSSTTHIGPPLVFEKLWEELGMPGIVQRLLAGRKFEFSLERVMFITALHRLFAPGSDRAALRWCRKYAFGDIDNLDLQHFYRTMGWLGEPLPSDQQSKQPGLSPRLRKDLIMVEDAFRTMKTILQTRPIYHKCDDTIRGHVFCSFLALVLQRELHSRLESRGWQVEWARLCDDLDELQELTLKVGEKTFLIRTPPVGDASRAIQAAGVALGPTVKVL